MIDRLKLNCETKHDLSIMRLRFHTIVRAHRAPRVGRGHFVAHHRLLQHLKTTWAGAGRPRVRILKIPTPNDFFKVTDAD